MSDDDVQRTIDFATLIEKKKRAIKDAEQQVNELRRKINKPNRGNLPTLLDDLRNLIKRQRAEGLYRPSSSPPKFNEQHEKIANAIPQHKNIGARVQDIEYTLKKKGTLFYRGNKLTGMNNAQSEFSHKFSRGLFLGDRKTAEEYTGSSGSMDEYELIDDVKFFNITPNNVNILLDMILTVNEPNITLRFNNTEYPTMYQRQNPKDTSVRYTIDGCVKIVEKFLNMSPTNRTDFKIESGNNAAYTFCELCAYFGLQGVHVTGLNRTDDRPYGDVYFLSFPRLHSRVQPIENRILFPGLDLKRMKYTHVDTIRQMGDKHRDDYLKKQKYAMDYAKKYVTDMKSAMKNSKDLYIKLVDDLKKYPSTSIHPSKEQTQIMYETEMMNQGLVTLDEILAMYIDERIKMVADYILSL